MKSTLTRRDFLKLSGITAGAAAVLAACGNDSTASNETASNETASTENTLTNDLQAGEEQKNEVEIDDSRRTTDDSDEKYPKIVLPATRDVSTMDITSWWSKDCSKLMFECLGEDNKATNWPDWVIANGEPDEPGDKWMKFTYEKLEDGTDSKWAESVEECAEGDEGAKHVRIMDVTIYDYIHDWNGNPINAEDVVWSYRRTLLSGNALKYMSYIWCEATGDYTIRFYMDFDEMKSLGPVEFPFCKTTIFSKAGDEAGNYSSEPVATGRYKLVEFISSNSITLELDENYWQTDDSLIIESRKGNVQTVKYQIITEAAQQIVALQTGSVTCMANVSNADAAQFADGGQYAENWQIYRTTTASTYGVMFNCYKDCAFSDINLRIAACYAISPEAVAAGCGNDAYFALKGAGSSGCTDYDENLESDENWQTQFDVDKAKEYLAKTSYNGETLSIMCSNASLETNMSQVVQQLLQNIGIIVEVNPVASDVGNSMQPDPSAWDLFLFSTQGSCLVGGINRILGRTDFDTTSYIGYLDSIGFQNDDELYQLFKTANSQDGFSKENTTAMVRHIVDNAYMKFCCGQTQNYVYSKDVAKIVTAWPGEIRWQACTYYLDDIIGVAD